MVGLNKWCKNQSVPSDICDAMRKGRVWQDDVDRLKELRRNALGDDGGLSEKEAFKHKLWEIKVPTRSNSIGMSSSIYTQQDMCQLG